MEETLRVNTDKSTQIVIEQYKYYIRELFSKLEDKITFFFRFSISIKEFYLTIFRF